MNNQNSNSEDLLALILAVRNQLEFYQDLGLTHIGSTKNTTLENILSFDNTENMAKKTSQSIDQLPLFDIGDKPQNSPSSFSINKSLGKETLLAIRAETGHCCQLCNQATQVVFGEGNPTAELMFIGEAPGAEEDATGRPFVGQAGRLLDKIIAAIGFKREDVYITNVVKCRPPNNRKPTPDEMQACEPFLFNEIELIKPKIIVTLGATPLTCLLGTKEGITKTRGQFYYFQGIPVMPTFHPAFLLRVPERKREVWEDMKQVMNKLQEIRKTSE